ncbi:MAG TPA: phosphotransferase family protein [Thermoleophilaceae bacterium]|nr:phosphotransferase family protein [Thermoleophilaceae bacterium]
MSCQDSGLAMASLEIVDTPAQAAEQELPPLIVRDPLEAFLDEHGLGSGPLGAERIGEGHSNVTYLVRRGEERFVLRRPPRPPLPPSAHDVLREARLLRAVEGRIRTPRVLAASEDDSILGVPFYVMEYMQGTVITQTIPGPIDNPEGRAAIADELVRALVEVHALDWSACGLEGFGKPTGYLDRQLRRFSGLWEHNKTRELPLVEELYDWLTENKPESPEATIVHGDFRLGNTMFADETPARLVAIFDWEMATIGDPLADVGYMTATWSQRDDPTGTMFDLTTVTHGEGFPTRDELVTRYEELSGRSMSDLRWYQALALWKAAVFMEGNYKRSVMGTTDDEYLKLFDKGVPMLANAALEITQRPLPGS